MAKITETIHKDNDNVNVLRLNDSEGTVSLANVSKIVIEASNSSFPISSVDYPTAITWSTAEDGDLKGVVYLKLGSLEIPKGTYLCTIVLYDIVNIKGIEWDDTLELVVI